MGRTARGNFRYNLIRKAWDRAEQVEKKKKNETWGPKQYERIFPEQWMDKDWGRAAKW